MRSLGRIVVIDNGTGMSKLGYAGNLEPSFVIPTVLGEPSGAVKTKGDLEDLDFVIGDEALAASGTHSLIYPMRQGQIVHWDAMERYWQQCIYRYLRCEPEEHSFLLTEPPLNPPEARESTAEIMFETFGVAGLTIAVSAVLALHAVPGARATGLVVDSGDGVTQCIPVVEGYVLPSGIKSVPIGGKDITQFTQRLLCERESHIPREDAMAVAQRVKEQYGTVAKDLADDFAKEVVTTHTEIHQRTKKEYTIDVGFERYLGPEVFFNPSIYSAAYTTPLSDLVDEAIRTSPVDVRRSLYGSIVLAGGSTMFANFSQRLQRDVKRLVTARYTAAGIAEDKIPKVAVVKHERQKIAAWFGGSSLAARDPAAFHAGCRTKKDYEEHGPACCRYNQVFAGVVRS